jgi:hypothetical protein
MAIGAALVVMPRASRSAPLLSVDFGTANNTVQDGFSELAGAAIQSTASATFGSYSVNLAGQGFGTANNSHTGSIDSSVRGLFRDYYYHNSETNGVGVTLSIVGVTPGLPYNLTVWSYDGDQVFSSTPTVWNPINSSTGGSGSITNFAVPFPSSLSQYSATFPVTSSTSTMDIFGTTTSGGGGTRLNGFVLNDGSSDVLKVDFGQPAPPPSPVQAGFNSLAGATSQASASGTFGAYTVGVQGQGFEDTADANANEIDPSIRNLYRATYYNNSDVNGEGVTLTIAGVTPNTDYDVKVWSYDPAQSFSSTPTQWSPSGATTGASASITNFAFPRPATLDDYSATIRVRSTTDTLTIFGTTTAGFGGTRLNAVELYAVAVPGDFDSDGDVDGADFVAWQTNFPKATDATLAQGDADGDGDVDGADFVVWQTNFPFTPGPGATAVPEPSAWLLGLFSISALVRLGNRRKQVAI